MADTRNVFYGFERIYPLGEVGSQNRIIDLVFGGQLQASQSRQYVKSPYGGLNFSGRNWLFTPSFEIQIDKVSPEDFLEWEYLQYQTLTFQDIVSTTGDITFTRTTASDWSAHDEGEDRGALFLCNEDHDFIGTVTSGIGNWKWNDTTWTANPPSGYDGLNTTFIVTGASATGNWIIPGMWGVFFEAASTTNCYTHFAAAGDKPEPMRISAVVNNSGGSYSLTVDKMGVGRSTVVSGGTTGRFAIPMQQFGTARFDGWNIPKVAAELQGAWRKVTFNFKSADPPANIKNRQ